MMLGRFNKGDKSRQCRVPDHGSVLKEWADQHFVKCK